MGCVVILAEKAGLLSLSPAAFLTSINAVLVV